MTAADPNAEAHLRVSLALTGATVSDVALVAGALVITFGSGATLTLPWPWRACGDPLEVDGCVDLALLANAYAANLWKMEWHRMADESARRLVDIQHGDGGAHRRAAACPACALCGRDEDEHPLIHVMRGGVLPVPVRLCPTALFTPGGDPDGR